MPAGSGFIDSREHRGLGHLAFVRRLAGARREEAWAQKDHGPQELGEEGESPVYAEEDNVVADDVERRLPSPRNPRLECLLDAGEIGRVARRDFTAGVALEERGGKRLEVVEEPLSDIAEYTAGEATVEVVAQHARRGGEDRRDAQCDEDVHEDGAVARGDGVVDEAAEGHRDEGVERHVDHQACANRGDLEPMAAKPAAETNDVPDGTHVGDGRGIRR
jgi:hypothetical protein